jgi:hypothetical protein
MFRNQIPDDHTKTFVGLLYNFLKSENVVNQSYSAACIEKMLIKKSTKTGQIVLNNQNVEQEIIVGLLSNLCELLND